jgi:predicted DNA-binding transcriptional regulator AlpA
MSQNQIQNKPITFIRRKPAAARLGVSLATLDRMVRRGNISKPTRIAERATGWPESYIEDFIASKFTTEFNPQITSTK